MKTLLILPYFGKFNVYFHLWINSCAHNSDIDFLIITDSFISEELPSNVTVKYTNFSDLKDYFQTKFDFPISLKRPYKLCDYRPYYGYLFSEQLQKYDFWGYCDCDVIWGDILQFITPEIFNEYDKILRLGHLTFIRNTPEINTNFKKFETYRIVLSSDVSYAYDESIFGYHFGFAGELIQNGYKFYQDFNNIADIDFRHFPFHIVNTDKQACVFEYKNGKLFQIFKEKNELKRNEIMYLHLQKRKMTIDRQIDKDHYLVIPNQFTTYEASLLENDCFWDRVSTEKKNYYNKTGEHMREIIRSGRRLLHEPHKMQAILYRIKNMI